jgi:predicted AlkP superfamily pyrophosphatase or phosphodiesterase
MHFSYPGYSEVLCGFADDTIDSNDKRFNRNVTVLEWLNRKPELTGRVAAFSSWDVFPFIINNQRSGIPVNGGFAPLEGVTPTDEVKLLNRLMTETPLFGEATRFDAFTYHAALLYLKEKKPRVLFLSFDETDTQGHAGRYDRVLASANRNDGFIADLWQTIQSMPEYAGKTSLVITTDHGRGDPPVDWKSHSAKVPGSDYIWAAFLGPDTPARGELKEVPEFTQSQIAATIAKLLGYDYNADVPKAAVPIDAVTAKGD